MVCSWGERVICLQMIWPPLVSSVHESLNVNKNFMYNCLTVSLKFYPNVLRPAHTRGWKLNNLEGK